MPFPLYRARFQALSFLTLPPGPSGTPCSLFACWDRHQETERQWDSRNCGETQGSIKRARRSARGACPGEPLRASCQTGLCRRLWLRQQRRPPRPPSPARPAAPPPRPAPRLDRPAPPPGLCRGTGATGSTSSFLVKAYGVGVFSGRPRDSALRHPAAGPARGRRPTSRPRQVIELAPAA